MDQNRELLFRERPNVAREEPRVNEECQWNLEAWGVRNGLGPEGMGGRYSGADTERLATHKKGSCTVPGYVRTCWPLSF